MVEPSEQQALLTREVIGAAIEVHKHLGPGLLESVYETCLVRELGDRGLSAARQVLVPIEYKGSRLDTDLRMVVVVEGQVVVEIKAIAAVLPIHEAQLLTYMRLSQMPLGLLINFNVTVLHNGVIRRVLSEFLTQSASPSASSASLR